MHKQNKTYVCITAPGGMTAPKDMIGAGLAKFKKARDSSSDEGGFSDEWDSD